MTHKRLVIMAIAITIMIATLSLMVGCQGIAPQYQAVISDIAGQAREVAKRCEDGDTEWCPELGIIADELDELNLEAQGLDD